MATKKKTKPFDTNLTQAEFKSRIVSALRQASRWWGPKKEAIGRARVRRWIYRCEECWEEGPLSLPPEKGKKRKRKNIQADHFLPVVPVTGWVSYDSWIENCFVPAEAFQALCWKCHTRKTKEENAERKLLRKK